MVRHSYLFKSFPQLVMIHRVKGFSVVDETTGNTLFLGGDTLFWGNTLFFWEYTFSVIQRMLAI